jgi:threonine dehydratase
VIPTATVDADLVSIEEIRAAAERVRGVARRTPLLPVDVGQVEGAPRGSTVLLKAENLQPIGAFKIRGAYNAIASLTPEERAAGVVAHSSGNHAQGVARAARLLGVSATIVMPEGASAVKVAGVEADGARIVTVGPLAHERSDRSAALARDEGLTLVPSYDDRRVICGQGTAGLEIVEQILEAGLSERPLCVIVPIGGGGLISGVAAAVKELRPDALVWGVEPDVGADARDSLREGRIVRWDPEAVNRTIADGQRSSSVGRLNFAHLMAYVGGVVAVSDTEIARAMARTARSARLVAEPSGATAVAAWLFHAAEIPVPDDAAIVAFVSGGNVDLPLYAALLADGVAAGG